MKRLSFVLLAAALFLLPVTAPGQSVNDEEVTEFVVTATRLPTPVDQISGTILVITSEDIEKKQARTVADALSGLPGVDLVNQGGLGKTSSALLRGGDARFTLVLIDGVEVNDPSNPERTFDLAHLSTEDIDRIEVLFGPQSTLYGSDAIGGVIQIFTRKGEGDPSAEVSMEAGSFNTRRTHAALRGGSGRAFYSFSGALLRSDGISIAARSDGNTEKDGYENTTLSGHFGFKTENDISLQVDLRRVDAGNDLDYYGGPGGDDPNFTGDAEQMLTSVKAEGFLTETWEASLQVSRNVHERHDLNMPDPARPYMVDMVYEGTSTKTELINNLYLGDHSIITLGFDAERESGESSYFSDEFGPYTTFMEEESAAVNGVFLQEQYAADSGLSLTLGARRDDHTRFGEETTWRAGFSAPVFREVRFRAVYGTGFRAPSVDQLFNPGYGNARLEAEKSRGWDAGLEWNMSRKTSASLSWHLTEYDDLIAWFDADGDPLTWEDGGYENVSRAETEGVDLSFEARASIVTLGFTGSLLRTEDGQGEELLRRPKTRLGARLGFAPTDRFNCNLNAHYVGKRRDWGDVTLDSYTLVSLAGAYRVEENIFLEGRVENLTDEEYELADGYGTAGRAGYLGVRVKL